MKIFIFLCLSSLCLQQQVLVKNTCSTCLQLKSKHDCVGGRVVGCEWVQSTDDSTNNSISGSCQMKAIVSIISYCSSISTSTCAQTLGCAYSDSKCTPFAGCSAYAYSTTEECQAISFECVSDGTSCIKASLCKDDKTYEICESTPSISGVLKCKWDSSSNACRDYVCSEADSNLTTDAQCSNWLSGCVTRGNGCWTSPLPKCSAYTGDATTCVTYVGSDGNCELQTGTSNCFAKICSNAPTTTASDGDCQQYQKGCITTGKGCTSGTLQKCSSYKGDISSCVGYIGSDGVCEGDAGGSQCRARKCENAPASIATDADCAKYKTGCKTTGKGCIATLGSCSSYQGTTITCVGFIGTDGYCKGTKETAGSCAPKVCEEAPTTNTTEADCASYEIGCTSTGQGCVKTLLSCQLYTGDASSCLSRIGSEGNCTWTSGTNCVARTCIGAVNTLITNTECAQWFTNCVTNGIGCVPTTSCDSTVKDLSCLGKSGCSWQPICISNDGCSSFQSSVSICAANKARVHDTWLITYEADGVTIKSKTEVFKFINCAWRNGYCVKMECSDLTGTYYASDANCAAASTGCISNRKDACILPTDCSKLTGTADTCKGYSSAYCTNSASATDTTACINRLCTDNTTATDTATCNNWLPGCIYSGSGCVDGTSTCSSMKGSQETCNGLNGFVSGTTYQQCYNISSAVSTNYCVPKTCNLATGKTSDNDCSSFYTGCIYDGNQSCLIADTAGCVDFNNGSDGSYCDKAIVKGQSAKYCYGSGNNTSCKVRVCSDNTTAQDQNTCDTFKTGCIYKPGGGCDDYSNVLCSSQTGTITTCPNYFGNVSGLKIRCTKLDACKDRQCSDKTATQASDCTNWKSTCRFLKVGSSCIDQNVCGSYNTPDTATTDQLKFNYCTSITDSSGVYCGFTSGASTCSNRSCDQFLSTYITTLTCSPYNLDPITLKSICNFASPMCYAPQSDCLFYIIDLTTYNDDIKRTTYCQSLYNSAGLQCNFNTGDTNCSPQDTCEKVLNQSAKVCNDLVGKGNLCQKGKYSTSCTTTVAGDCTSYILPSDSLTDSQKTEFCNSLKVVDALNLMTNGMASYFQCTWISGSTCATVSDCSQIVSSVGYTYCNSYQISCSYYKGKCLSTSSSTCPTSFPADVTTDTQKAIFCMANYESTTSTYCQLSNDRNSCIANASSNCVITVPNAAGTLWNGVPITDQAYCQDHSTKQKVHCVADTANPGQCKQGTCEDIPNPKSLGDCDSYMLNCFYSNNKCYTSYHTSYASQCTQTQYVLFGSNIQALSTSDKVEYCQLFSRSDSKYSCTYDTSQSPPPTTCAAAADCSTYSSGSSNQFEFCNSKVNGNGVKCTWTSGAFCRNQDCYEIASPQSQVDCDIYSQRLRCVYSNGRCYNKQLACNNIPVVGLTLADLKTFCEAKTSSSGMCRYAGGTNCVLTAPSADDKLAVCNTLIDGSKNPCTFINKTGATKCVQKDTCINYSVDSGSESTQCAAVKSTAGYPCQKDPSNAGKCIALTCENITTGESDCSANASGCLYYSNACFTQKTCGAYTFSASVNTVELQSIWCKGVTSTTGNQCKWDSVNAKCADRVCSDVQFYTDFDCNAYLKGCKTDGTKCIDGTSACNCLNGDTNFCNLLADSTGKDKCQPTQPASPGSGSCIVRSCYDNVISTTDEDCIKFMVGCVTRGTGCLPKTSPCDLFRGTKDKCEEFKQYLSTDASTGDITYQYCSGDAANGATSPCKVRLCTDNTTAKDNDKCASYLTGCVTSGKGCIEESAPCTQYKGTNSQCYQFMGSSGNDYCQGTASDATTVVSCRKRLCTDLSATSNLDCYNGMKPKKGATIASCVFDGANSCVDHNNTCSFFQGDVNSCATYIATDGPCKATTIGNLIGQCTQRICTEAPNTLATDADCQAYHPSCYTTGYGCTTTSLCSTMVNYDGCSQKVNCTWANQCTQAISNCSTFSNTSQSQCMNSKVNGQNCVWQEIGSICRPQICTDQPGTINDHLECQEFSATCTTSGAGCITIGECNTYKVQSICFAASTTSDGIGRCTWENNVCRPRICSDKSSDSTTDCDAFLSGCQTNGTTCVAAISCKDFNGNQQYCQKSQTGPCLYVGGICYNYMKCEDAPGKTHDLCQKFSPLCTTNGTNCIPITSCAATKKKISCVVGTDGSCGWLPAGGENASEKCQLFGACSDAIGTAVQKFILASTYG